MKITAAPLIVFIALLVLQSCSTEEMEAPKLHPVKFEPVINNAMMQRDSISKDDGIDPPTKPIISGTRP